MSASNTRKRESGNPLILIRNVVTQPKTFFKNMPTRGQWFWVAALILIVSAGLSVFQYRQSFTQGGDIAMGDFSGISVGDEFDLGDFAGMEGFGSMEGGGAGTGDAGEPSNGTEANAAQEAATDSPSVTQQTEKGVIAAMLIIGVWVFYMVMLSEVSLFRAERPQFSKNFQIAIWASIPIMLFTGIRLAYNAAGGTITYPGLTSALTLWAEGYGEQTLLLKELIFQFLSKMTLPFLWSMILLYIGSRYALKGGRLASMFVVTFIFLISIIAPALFGTYLGTPASASIPTSNSIDDYYNDMGSFDDLGNFDDMGDMGNFDDMGSDSKLSAETQPEVTPEAQP